LIFEDFSDDASQGVCRRLCFTKIVHMRIQDLDVQFSVSFNSDGGGRLVSNLVVVVTGYCSGGVGWWCGVWISYDSAVTDLGYDCVLTRRVCRCVC
jgi:hypothetical protein